MPSTPHFVLRRVREHRARATHPFSRLWLNVPCRPYRPRVEASCSLSTLLEAPPEEDFASTPIGGATREVESLLHELVQPCLTRVSGELESQRCSSAGQQSTPVVSETVQRRGSETSAARATSLVPRAARTMRVWDRFQSRFTIIGSASLFGVVAMGLMRRLRNHA